MKIKLNFTTKDFEQSDLKIIAAFSKEIKNSKNMTVTTINNSHWGKELIDQFNSLKSSKKFRGESESSFKFYDCDGRSIYAAGLGQKNKDNAETIRKAIANAFKAALTEKVETISIDLDGFNILRSIPETAKIITETIILTNFNFDKYKSDKKDCPIKTVILNSKDNKSKVKAEQLIALAKNNAESVNFCRELIHEVPNVLNSETFAKKIEADVKENLKGVKTKILKDLDIKKEKMNLFLSVNAGSAYGPRLVHLTYSPKKITKNTKHIAIVGKGITFDTGGYNLKPSTSLASMKGDMGGAATMYGAFRAAVLAKSPYKITCILPMTDNAINSNATKPDAVIIGRSGKSVEILNTDAEGRLILADAIDYACDLKPDMIIDAATLTGACLVALGTEVCAIMGNNEQLTKKILHSAKSQDEYMWELPIIPEWKKDIKSKIADIKNIGGSKFAGTAKAAAFIEEFVKNDIPWAHLDIAGVSDDQSHLPYCPTHGGSGVIVRTLIHYLTQNA